MKLQRTMEMNDMKMVHDEVMRISQEQNGVVSPTNQIELSTVSPLDNQLHVLSLVEGLTKRYAEFDARDEGALDVYTHFITQVKGVVCQQTALSSRNYASLLKVTSDLAVNVQELKLQELEATGYWENRDGGMEQPLSSAGFDVNNSQS